MFYARVGLALAIVLLGTVQSDAQLMAELRRAVTASDLGRDAIAGIAIRDANTGELIFEHNADQPLAPASNQKLLTSAAAVIILGPAYAYTTELVPTTDGALVLVGTGDPAFADPEVLETLEPALASDDVLDLFAATAAERIESATELIIDDRVFDRELIHPDWPRDQLERWYCAPVQGINVHANVLAFYPSPSGGGVTAGLEPAAGWVDITDRAEIIDAGRNAVWIQRTETDDAYVIRGSIRTRAQAPIEVSLHQPALFAGRLVAERLEAAGVTFNTSSGTPLRLAEPDEIIEHASEPIAVWATPLDDILERCNHDSMNLHAEALLKSLGRAVTGESGTWQNGVAVLRMLMVETLGASDITGTIIRDGSGLSRENRITASTLSAWLATMHTEPEVRDMFRETLPTARGKLARRFNFGTIDHSVYAKTGTINHVRCLSGYVTNEHTGQTAAFSILCNGLTTGQSVRAAYRLQAAIIEALDDNISELTLPVDEPQAIGG